MKKNFKAMLTAIVCFCLSSCMLLSTAFADTVEKTQRLDFRTASSESKHIYNVTETNDWLVRNNSTDYVVVVPHNMVQHEEEGSRDFVGLFKEATGATLRIVTDNEYGVWSKNSKIISYGHTSFLDDAGVDYKKYNLGNSGFIIKTVGKSIFITGDSDDRGDYGWGTAFGGYELLSQLVGFEQYGYDCYYYDSASELKLFDYDIVDIPDLAFRQDPNDIYSKLNETRRMRFQYLEWMIQVPGYGIGHNSFGFVSPTDWADEHPEWFNEEQTQLCLTARGDEESRQKMLDVASANMIKLIKENPELNYISISQQDTPNSDPYDSAYADEHYGGAMSGLWVRFCNELSDRMEEYFEANNIDREINIVFYAYVFTENAPVAMDNNGEFYATIKCKDNVLPWFAPIFQHEGDSVLEQRNTDVITDINQWSLVSDRLWIWLYNAGYSDFLIPRFSTASIQENARYMSTIKGLEHYFVQGQTYNSGMMWSFGDLTTYLTSKLSWNTSLDQEQLTAEFFERYYQDAAQPMMKVYRLMEANYHYQTQVNGVYMDTELTQWKNQMVYPLAFLNQLLAAIKDAENSIAKYKSSNTELYETLHKRILIEKIQFNYMIVYLYSNSFPANDILNLKKEIKKDCIYVGATYRALGAPITSLWEEWGI